MVKTYINLPPTKYRLHLKLVSRRHDLDDKPLLPNVADVLRIKKGSIFSRYFRHLFSHKRFLKLLRVNLALLALSFSFLPPVILANPHTNVDIEEVITTAPTVLKTTTSIRFPTNEINITQRYSFFHPGIDLDGITGDKIQPIMDGVVENIEYSRFGYGNSIIIKHKDNINSLYAHLSKIEVKIGDQVSASTEIGKMGASGRAFGDHLHLEVYKDGKAINPLTILSF